MALQFVARMFGIKTAAGTRTGVAKASTTIVPEFFAFTEEPTCAGGRLPSRSSSAKSRTSRCFFAVIPSVALRSSIPISFQIIQVCVH
jgi:hypothetical protein